MKLNQGVYLVRESFRTLRRHKGIASLSVAIMSLTLLVLAVFLMAATIAFVLVVECLLRFLAHGKLAA